MNHSPRWIVLLALLAGPVGCSSDGSARQSTSPPSQGSAGGAAQTPADSPAAAHQDVTLALTGL
jgi:hypothetical protein